MVRLHTCLCLAFLLVVPVFATFDFQDYNPVKKNFPEARKFCIDRGQRLLRPRTEAYQDFLSRYQIRKGYHYETLWIDLEYEGGPESGTTWWTWGHYPGDTGPTRLSFNKKTGQCHPFCAWGYRYDAYDSEPNSISRGHKNVVNSVIVKEGKWRTRERWEKHIVVCEKVSDPCSPNPCKNGGTCERKGSSYQCKCKRGFTGTNCEKATCDPNPCWRGTCRIVSGGTDFRCTCFPGFKLTGNGKACDVATCHPTPCVNGQCSVVNNQKDFRCTCHPGFKGKRCDQATCHPNPCIRARSKSCQVIAEGKDFRCECRRGYTGKRCGNPTCQPNPCWNGVCRIVSKPGGGKDFACTCHPGFRGNGKACDRATCHPNPCLNHGRCRVISGGRDFRCICPKGYTDKRCNRPTCSPNPCWYNGVCSITHINGKDDFRCQCPDGYIGRTCHQAKCYPGLCLNGATCILARHKRDFHCMCPPHFVGKRCDKNPCRGVTCQNNGTCRSTDRGFVCDCEEHPARYTGTFCDVELCSDDYCNCDQQCTLEGGKKKCDDWCDSHRFRKEGCPDGPGDVKCKSLCDPDRPATGYFACEFHIDACGSGTFNSPNYPNLYSSNSWYFYNLWVDPGSTIRLTFVTFSVELSSKCLFDVVSIFYGPFKPSNFHESICGNKTNVEFLSPGHQLVLKFKTDKSVQQTGFLASYSQVSCQPYSCQNGGTCVDNDDSCGYTCACVDGFVGDDCETLEPPTISGKSDLLVGEDTTLTCTSAVTGNTYHWYEGGDFVTSTNGNTYNTGPTTLDNNGDVYTCSFSVGGVTSAISTNSVTLTVVCPANKFGPQCKYHKDSCQGRCGEIHKEANCQCDKNCFEHFLSDTCCKDLKDCPSGSPYY